jgi:hypothetical protein
MKAPKARDVKAQTNGLGNQPLRFFQSAESAKSFRNDGPMRL